MIQRCPPFVTSGVAVLVDVPEDARKMALVVVDRHLLAEFVEEKGDLFAVAQAADDDSTFLEQRDVRSGVDDAIHERRVGRDMRADLVVALLERDEVPEECVGAVIDLKLGDLHLLILKADVQETRRLLLPPEVDSRFPELCRTWNPSQQGNGLVRHLRIVSTAA